MVMVMMFVMAYERYSHGGNDFEGATFVGLQLLIYYCFMIPIPTIFTSLKGC